MTCLQSTSANERLHARYAVWVQREETAGAIFDRVDADHAAALRSGGADCELARRYREADSEYDAAFNARADVEDALLEAPIETRDDVIAKLRIIVHRTESCSEPDVDDLLEQFADQVMALAEPRAS